MSTMFKVIDTEIRGFYELQPTVQTDFRGNFVKTFHKGFFDEQGLISEFHEEYYSVSKRRVLRGLHFQLPPHDHAKLVYCVHGEILDAAVDLRKNSPSFRRNSCIKLSAERSNIAYLSKGLAHGFCVLSEEATVVYNVSTVYAPEFDSGIRWDSAGIAWPDSSPVISERDSKFVPLSEFESPFVL